MKRLALSGFLALLITAPNASAAPAPEAARPKPDPVPAELWEKYPIGSETLESQPSLVQPLRRPPVRLPAQKAAAIPARAASSGTTVPLWAVLLAALGLSCVLGLAGEGLASRVKQVLRPKRPYKVVDESPARRAESVSLPRAAAVPAAQSEKSLASSLERLRVAAAGIGYEDPKLEAVIDATTTSPEWRPLALATVISSWEEAAVVPIGHSRAAAFLQPEEGQTTMGHSDLGNRVAAVLSAAEEVAERIREEAREEAAAITTKAEQAAAERVKALTREAEQLRAKAEKVLAEADAKAKAKREAAEVMARRIEAEALRHQDDLNAAAHSLEERLRTALEGLERVSTEVEHVLAPAEEADSPGGKPALRGL
jgi:cell division septum initiation protein DivIVA